MDSQGISYKPHNSMTCMPTILASSKSIDSSRDPAQNLRLMKAGTLPLSHRERYIKNFAKRALPLTNLLRKDSPFEWTCETQAAFDDIKGAILNPPVLALPDPDVELQITTDASSHGIAGQS
ncbi:transposon Tf2-9 polyprotein [Trichonephila clavipes]|nr:transposon Tf2-9 polyprotein [Trichonephila clavipes]